MSTTLAGGWSSWNFTISSEAKEAFGEALKGFVGVDYSPLAFASQVVSGMNYCYLCKAHVVYPGAPDQVAKVYIYKPLQGQAHITQIAQVTP